MISRLVYSRDTTKVVLRTYYLASLSLAAMGDDFMRLKINKVILLQAAVKLNWLYLFFPSKNDKLMSKMFMQCSYQLAGTN